MPFPTGSTAPNAASGAVGALATTKRSPLERCWPHDATSESPAPLARSGNSSSRAPKRRGASAEEPLERTSANGALDVPESTIA